jgi:phosphatidylserine/phosphatidylglycerophosphate/cardiolipin synthase-like enzyme
MASSKDFLFHDRPGYFSSLASDVSHTKRGDRVALASMSFEPTEPAIALLVQELCNAAKRGVKVYVAIDAYSFMVKVSTGDDITHTWLTGNLTPPAREPYQSRYEALRKLENCGVHTVVTNVPGRPLSTVPAGRSHIKAAVVNDLVYAGGCNLHSPEQMDVMVSWHDQSSADWTYETVREMVRQKTTQKAFGLTDRSHRVDDHTQLLLDSGKPGQSVIWDHAMRLIDEAREHVTITCQYFPGGRTAKHLLAAHRRGVKVEILYSHPIVQGRLGSLGHRAYQLREQTRLPADFFKLRLGKTLPILHAKIITTEQGAIVGSHNYVTNGVSFGTAEIALIRYDPAFSAALRTFITNQIDTNTNKR